MVNWKYDLEGQEETSPRRTTHTTQEYHPSPLSDKATTFSSIGPTQRGNANYELNVMRHEIVSLCEEVCNLTS